MIRHLRYAGAVLCLAALAAAPQVHAQAVRPDLSQVRVIAVAPFADETGGQDLLARHAAVRVGQSLPQQRVRVIPIDQTERTLREMGLRPHELIGLTNPMELGRRLGADAVITGRVLQVVADPGRSFPRPPPADDIPEGPREAFVALELRMLMVGARQVVIRDEFSGRGWGFFALRFATDRAVQDFIRRLNTLF